MKTTRRMRTFFSSVLTLGMAAAIAAVPVAAEDAFHYVSLGASNTNGYGMRGYITEEELNLMLSGQVSKDEVNVYGYQRTPEGAYPDLIRDYYTEQYGTVEIDQLAISSMRAEELRVLLDDTYIGDDYTSWRFTGDDGWFNSAEEGGLESLRAAYKESIADADLVTVDIGWNNFGVYVCNQLVDYMSNGVYKWTTDIADIFDTDAEIAAALEAKEIIRGYITETAGEGELTDALTDIFAYSILGYIHNFDICMEKITDLNPDAEVVVIGIQNLLYGVMVELNGEQIALGDIFGNFVDMANYYISARSPYQEDYRYVKVGEDGHTTIFLDFMKTYDGDAEHLNQNVKDCFDYYDNDLFIQTRIDYVAAELIEDEYGSALSMLGYESGADVVAAGKKGELGSLQETFDSMYWPALYAAYDTLAVLVQEIANYESVDGNSLAAGTLDIGAEEDALADALMAEIEENALAAADGQEYTVDLEKILPDADAKIVAAMYIRYYMGNSFFAHPNETGHAEIRDAVIGLLNDPASETDQAISDYLAESVIEIHRLLCGAQGHTYEEGFCTECGAEYRATVSVSGNVTSWTTAENADNTVTLTFTDEAGEATVITLADGETAYTAELEAGTYTLTVKKANHVTRAYTVVVEDKDITQDVTVNPVGDANLDGSISVADYNAIYNHLMVVDKEIVDEYVLLCADANRDGEISVADYNAIYNHLMVVGKELW